MSRSGLRMACIKKTLTHRPIFEAIFFDIHGREIGGQEFDTEEKALKACGAWEDYGEINEH